tara:strand:- start:849 stop:1067 length:219 start_codon:yes stop_codon:yes gene_type:complete
MAILTLLNLDKDGNDVEISYELHDDVMEYIEEMDEDAALLFGELFQAKCDAQELKLVLEGYRILCGGREVDN